MQPPPPSWTREPAVSTYFYLEHDIRKSRLMDKKGNLSLGTYFNLIHDIREESLMDKGTWNEYILFSDT